MISDLYPPEKRATAVGVYYMAYPIGGLIAFGLGGVVAAAYGWRSALYVAAAPGFFLALLLLAFGREPPRENAPGVEAKAEAPPFREVVGFMVTQRAMLHAMAGMAITTLTSAGHGMFAFAFFMRYHHIDLHRLGPIMGLGYGVFGVIALLFGGLVADRLGRSDPRKRLWLVSISLAAVTPIVLLVFVLPFAWAMGLYLAHFLVINLWFGPAISEVQNLAPARMRSTVASIMYVMNGFVGYGLGPVVVGVLSDVLKPWAGAEALRYALLLVTCGWLWAALHHHLATRTLRADLVRAQTYA
jgi:MFS family permease